MVDTVTLSEWGLVRLPGVSADPPLSAGPYAPDQTFPEFRGGIQPGTAPNPVFAAHNPAIGDFVGAAMVGGDRAKIPLLRHVCDDMRWRVCHTAPAIPAFSPPFPAVRPPKGWVGHLEVISSR
jgi:hypothetical protein